MKRILFVIIILNIGLASAGCSEVFFFLIENNGEYTKEDLTALNVSEDFIINYEQNCERGLPFNKKEIEFIDTKTINEECKTEINKSLFWDSYDLDTSIPFFDVYTSKLNCENSKYYRWVVEIKKDSPIFHINGIKLWIILFPTILIVCYFVAKDVRKTNNLLNKVSINV